MSKTIQFLGLIFLLAMGCQSPANETELSRPTIDSEQGINKHLVQDYQPKYDNNDINVVIEIPTGTLEKWEVSKSTGQLELEQINGKPRLVDYLGYPGNYGMIPRTLLPKSEGGDGDPLDVIVLGAPVERGIVIRCKLVGVLKLLDKGEQDDKLIAVRAGTPFYNLNSLEELDTNYQGVSEILSLWFANYKGEGKMEFQGFGNSQEALSILDLSITAYKE